MLDKKNPETAIAGLSVVLRPLEKAVASTPLTHWLPEAENTLVWIGLSSTRGVTKVMPVLPHPQLYPQLFHSIRQQIPQRTVVEWEAKLYEVTGVEVETQGLYLIQVLVTPSKPLPATLGRAIHALFFKWLNIADPPLAEELHGISILPATLAIEPTFSRHQLKLRIGIFQKKVLAPLLWGLSQDLGGNVTLAKVQCKLGQSVEIEKSSFEELATKPAARAIELQFLTPTSFKQQQEIQPFPLPELVFDNLLRRWNAFAPEEFHFPPVTWQCLVSAFDLKTYALKMKAGAEIGAQGWVKYRFPNPEQAAIATVLAHFGIYAGVGRKTAMGMGQVRIVSESR